MPTTTEFLEATTVRLGGKVGFANLGPVLTRDRLEMVDISLNMWWQTPPTDRDDKMRVTLRLMKACADWAKKHQTNKGASRTGAQRMIAVSNLVQQCKLWLGKLNAAGGTMKTLGAGYAAERTVYKTAKTAGNRINPVAGGFVHAEQTGAKGDDPADSPIGPLLAKPFAQLTAQDFVTIHNHVLPGDTKMGRTLYLNSDERQSYLLEVKNGVFVDSGGAPLTTKMMYAMSKYGTLYGFDAFLGETYWKLEGKSTEFINHSSFTAGKDVICAGTIEPVEGSSWQDYSKFKGLWAITTLSGHYQPTVDNLKNCLRALWASGLNLDKYVGAHLFNPKRVEAASDFMRS